MTTRQEFAAFIRELRNTVPSKFDRKELRHICREQIKRAKFDNQSMWNMDRVKRMHAEWIQHLTTCPPTPEIAYYEHSFGRTREQAKAYYDGMWARAEILQNRFRRQQGLDT